MNDVVPDTTELERADLMRNEAGEVKVRFTLDGKRYKMLIDEETFNALQTEPGQEIKELTLKEGDE